MRPDSPARFAKWAFAVVFAIGLLHLATVPLILGGPDGFFKGYAISAVIFALALPFQQDKKWTIIVAAFICFCTVQMWQTHDASIKLNQRIMEIRYKSTTAPVTPKSTLAQ